MKFSREEARSRVLFILGNKLYKSTAHVAEDVLRVMDMCVDPVDLVAFVLCVWRSENIPENYAVIKNEYENVCSGTDGVYLKWRKYLLVKTHEWQMNCASEKEVVEYIMTSIIDARLEKCERIMAFDCILFSNFCPCTWSDEGKGKKFADICRDAGAVGVEIKR